MDNRYVAGAGTQPGAGRPGVLASARVLDTIVPAPDAFDVSVPQNGAGAHPEPVA